MSILMTLVDWIMYFALFGIFILAIFRIKQMYQDLKDAALEDKQAREAEPNVLKANN